MTSTMIHSPRSIASRCLRIHQYRRSMDDCFSFVMVLPDSIGKHVSDGQPIRITRAASSIEARLQNEVYAAWVITEAEGA